MQQASNGTQAAAAAAPPKPGTPEHDAAMAAKFDAANGREPAASGGANSQAATPPVKPEGVPDKFWDATKGVVNMDAWAKSYAELERKQSQPNQQQQQPASEKPADQQQQQADPAKNVQGFDNFAQEFAETGALSEASYAKLQAQGIPKAMVDGYIEGQLALANQAVTEAFNAAGGEEQYKAMTAWARTLPKAELDAYNAAMDAPQAQRLLAIQGMAAKFKAANGGGEPQGALNGARAAGNVTGYNSRAEMTADMRDPRYRKDPAFRAAVEQKLAVTTAF